MNLSETFSSLQQEVVGSVEGIHPPIHPSVRPSGGCAVRVAPVRWILPGREASGAGAGPSAVAAAQPGKFCLAPGSP